MAASARKVSPTPTDSAEAKCPINACESGAARMAPPPNPMIAIPMASPRRSGNQRMSADVGVLNPTPSPQPPMTPYPRYSSPIRWVNTPTADTTKPPLKQMAAASPLVRGPTRCCHLPATPADRPRKMYAIVKIQPSCASVQSAGAEASMPTTLVSGRLNTLNADTCPILRLIPSDAKIIHQRLNDC